MNSDSVLVFRAPAREGAAGIHGEPGNVHGVPIVLSTSDAREHE